MPINGEEKINAANFIYGTNIILFYFMGAVGVILTVILSSVYKYRLTFVTIISNGTIIIMVFHVTVNSVLLALIGLSNKNIDIITALLISVINIAITIPLIYMIQKYFPVLLGMGIRRHGTCTNRG
jgi:fucose 4-O-acetylase-like acetyltransferase